MKRNLGVSASRVVVKVGTGVLASAGGHLRKAWIKKLVGQIATLINQGREVILVTSGAIGAGMGLLRLEARPKLLPQQQAAAAVGQNELMKIYSTFFKTHHLLPAQLLLTSEDLSNRHRYLNAKNTLSTLLSYKVVPVINENDTVSVDEIKFGDNDKLSALVATLVQADLLIILSDVDGLYAKKEQPEVISRVEQVGPQIERLARASTTELGTGGMASKVAAAKICAAAGIACIIANGQTPNILLKIVGAEDIGTLFFPKKEQLIAKAKKRWIGFSAKVSGQLFVDAGAKQALILKKKSLLPKGIVRLRGTFSIGDTVGILDAENRQFARGLSNYSSGELDKIKGQKSNQIEAILGYKYYDEVVHRDNLVIL